MKILLLDVEATPNRLIYDIGYIIAELDTESNSFIPIKKRQHIIEEIFDNRPLFDTSYYHKKRPKYYGLLRAENTTEKILLKDSLKELRKDLKDNDINTIVAFNSSYDVGAFEKTCDYYHKSNPIAEKNDICIQALSNNHIHNTKDYEEFCKYNNYYTDKGYYNTNAEITYRYITEQNNFIEDHTGLKDCEIELQILNYILANGGTLESLEKLFFKTDIKQTFTIEVKDKKTNKIITTNRYKYEQKRSSGNNKVTLYK